jgi:hypothetical protein
MRIISLLTLLCSMLFIAGDADAQRWDRTGWTKLGERAVNGRVDRDTIQVGRYEGRFSKLRIVVENDDMELLDMDVYFANGQRWTPPGVRHYFRADSRSRVIDLPGDDRIIQRITMKYRNVGRTKGAVVEVWGFRTTNDGGGRDSARPNRGSTWRFNSAGWEMLGERIVDGGRRGDSDRITVGSYKGRFDKLTLVVLDSDIELISMEVKFASGPEWRPPMAHYFREDQRSRVIDLPGRDRIIRWIDFRYRNLPGGGKARVQVWAK